MFRRKKSEIPHPVRKRQCWKNRSDQTNCAPYKNEDLCEYFPSETVKFPSPRICLLEDLWRSTALPAVRTIFMNVELERVFHRIVLWKCMLVINYSEILFIPTCVIEDLMCMFRNVSTFHEKQNKSAFFVKLIIICYSVLYLFY